MSAHTPIPVEVAKQIATDFNKQIVVVLAYENESGLMHTTTYGVSPFDKENAAAAGEICTKALGFDLGKKQTFEDYHDNYDAAKYKRIIELMGDTSKPNDVVVSEIRAAVGMQ
jgi:hypothetical protein